jgi:hypothetical protein
VSREMGIASDDKSLTFKGDGVLSPELPCPGTVNVTVEVDLTELVPEVHLLAARGHFPLCILGAHRS